MYFQGVSQSKELLRNAKTKSISRKCNNQKYSQDVSQVKVQPGNATIIRTARECYKQNASIISTYREFRDQKYIQGGHIEKVLIENATIRSTARDCRPKMYYQGVLLFKIHPGNDTIKYTAGECHKPIWLQGSVTI